MIIVIIIVTTSVISVIATIFVIIVLICAQPQSALCSHQPQAVLPQLATISTEAKTLPEAQRTQGIESIT